MIARVWRGATASDDADEYVEYLKRTGLKDYRTTPGNRGAYVLWRQVGDRAEFVTLSLWDSTEAIVLFAGEDIDRAVFYADDDRYLVDRDLTVAHYHVVT